MCGRYTLKASKRTLKNRFQLNEDPPEFEPRYNLAPGQTGLIVRESRRASLSRWGLPVSGRFPCKKPAPLINVRAESVAEKPTFRDAFRYRRCLVLADGFYEWKRTGVSNRPYYVHFADGAPFAMAGLWAEPSPENEDADGIDFLGTFAILTTEASSLLRSYHHRMPVILDARDGDVWLRPESSAAELRPLLRASHSAGAMDVRAANICVNHVGNEGPVCLQASPPETESCVLQLDLGF